MSIYFHNTASRHKDEFKLNVGTKVSLYTCGPTVYNHLHIGNWVAYVRWDTLVRTLKASGYQVERVMNITDVGHLTSDADEGEDKMEKGARREGKTAWDVAKLYTDDFLQGMHALNLLIPDHVAKATDHIEAQLELVRTLKAKGYTYQISDGIYFDTTKFPAYADFAQLDLEALKAGARVEVNSEKRQPSDFALWKFTPTGQKRDMEWATPVDLLEDGATQKGFPGWHLECSAMAMQYLGDTIDIHTGGIDHIPVHHTNEIAQSEAASGKPFAHFWLHNAHLLSNGTKISKSLDNGHTLADIAEKGYSPMDFRMFVLQSHYRTEGNFTWENLAAAQARLTRWKNIASLRWQAKDSLRDADEQAPDDMSTKLLSAHQVAVAALQDDMDTPQALRVIDEAFTTLEHGVLLDIHEKALGRLLEALEAILGLQLLNTTPDIEETEKDLIVKREEVRTRKDWAESDNLRDQLNKRGVGVRDTPQGSIWYRL